MQRRNLLKWARNLNKRKMLLLVGGAFGFAALIGWCAWAYRPMLDRTASAPSEAVFAFSLRQPLPDGLAASFPSGLREALKGSLGAYATASATDSSLTWHGLAETGHWRIAAKGIGAVGFVHYQDMTLPIEATVGNNGFQARVGRGFRGIDLGSPLNPSGLLRVFPAQSSVYISDRSFDASSEAINVLLQAQKSEPAASLRQLWQLLPGRKELELGQNGNDLVQPFVITTTPDPGVKIDLDRLDAALRELAGRSNPVATTLTLPDQTTSKELRSSSASLKIETRQSQNGLIRRFVASDGSTKIIYFLSSDGNLWISNYASILQQFITVATDDSLIFPDCLSSNDLFTEIIHPKELSSTGTKQAGITQYYNGFKTVIFSLKQKETGLFTVCGYHG